MTKESFHNRWTIWVVIYETKCLKLPSASYNLMADSPLGLCKEWGGGWVEGKGGVKTPITGQTDETGGDRVVVTSQTACL